PLEKTDYAENIYWVYGIVLKDDIPFDAKEAMQKLGKQGIGTRPFFWPMHLQPVLLENNLFQGEKYPVAERISKRGFYIPSGLGLDDFKIEKVVIILQQILHE
ncbi:aminotransferase DegT, partial [Candidatus Woesearchaeota archaeon]|nr:aminotransferase DegT [Candidatus Woesearchaeota archaeon]